LIEVFDHRLLFTHDISLAHFFFLFRIFSNIIYKYSLEKDLVDTVVMAVEDQAQGSQEKPLDMVVTVLDLIQRVQREATEDTDQARAVANLVRDHLVDTDMAVDQAQVNLARADMVRASQERDMVMEGTFVVVLIALSFVS